MRILHILDHSLPLHSGYSFRTRSILREQHKLGWETIQLTSAKQGESKTRLETCDGLSFYRSKQPSKLVRSLPVINQLGVVHTLERRLAEVVAKEKPDILHAHSPALNGLAAMSVARKTKLPLVYEFRAFWEDAAVDHGTTNEGSLRYRISRALESFVLRRADAVTTICEGIKGDLLSRGLSENDITIIPNAVDVNKFSHSRRKSEKLVNELGLGGKTVIGFIGSFYAYEGLDLLLDSLPDIRKKCSDVIVLLVGGGPQEDNLKSQAMNNALAEQVRFTGRIPHAQVSDYYDLIDVLVYPRHSMRLTELVTPLKPLEAMAQGRILIASDVGGHRELIKDGETGILFPAGDANALAKAVVHLLESPNSWQDLKNNARAYVAGQRTWERSVANYCDVYERVLKKRVTKA